jgi:hypothetical protein
MTTKNIEIIPIEQSSSATSSHVDAKVKLNSNSNIHDLKSQSIAKNRSSMIRKDRRTRNMSITYDVSTTRKIRIAKYTLCLLVWLWFTLIVVRSKIFHSIPFSIRLFIAFAALTSMAIVTGVLVVYFTAPKPTSMFRFRYILWIERSLRNWNQFSIVTIFDRRSVNPDRIRLYYICFYLQSHHLHTKHVLIYTCIGEERRICKERIK